MKTLDDASSYICDVLAGILVIIMQSLIRCLVNKKFLCH